MNQPYLTDEQFEEWKNLKGNFTTSPNYIDLILGIRNVLSWYYRSHMWRGYTFPRSFIEDFTRHFYFPLHEVCYIVYITIIITLLR